MRRRVKQVWRGVRALLGALSFCGLLASPALAHEPSKSYLSLTFETNRVSGQWDVPINDLKKVLPAVAGRDGVVTWDDINASYSNITQYVFARLNIVVNGRVAPARVVDSEPEIEEFNDGAYVRIPFTLDNIFDAKT